MPPYLPHSFLHSFHKYIPTSNAVVAGTIFYRLGSTFLTLSFLPSFPPFPFPSYASFLPFFLPSSFPPSLPFLSFLHLSLPCPFLPYFPFPLFSPSLPPSLPLSLPPFIHLKHTCTPTSAAAVVTAWSTKKLTESATGLVQLKSKV